MASWCDVWTASALAERPDDPPRPHGDHLALGRQLVEAAVPGQLAAMPEVRRVSTYHAEDDAPRVAVDEALGFVPAGALSSWSTRL